jgi:hypothetical protein
VDSGADATSFPQDWAAILGIDLDECQAVKVTTGSGSTYHPEWDRALAITVAGRRVDIERPRFAPVQVAILGRRDFFMQFKVEIDERQRMTRLTPYASETGLG